MRNHPDIRRFLRLTAAALLCAFVSGCSSCKPGKPGPIGRYDIEVQLDDSLKQASVLVDLVGVNAVSLTRWENESMKKYWEDNSLVRKDAERDKKTFNFVSGKELKQTMEAKDPKWEQWKSKGVSYVLVLADLPGANVDKPGNQDARRLILPLDECHWPKKTSKLTVLVRRSGIDPLTPPRQ
jgi:hypothetical protein